jgi:SAM-dependent methyltransferase
MMQTQAPYAYIRDYYRQVQRKYERFPAEASFCRARLRDVRGPTVLNLGCGPLLYDDVLHFGAPPRDYLGLDINGSTFAFLQRSREPRLLRAKAGARALGTRVEHLCADIFDCGDRLEGRFDSVLGVGFFATFHGTRFERLMDLMRRTLKDGGRLLKITWHGPQRAPEETRKKLAYRYDSPEAASPAALVAGIEGAGFRLRHHAVLACDPASYGWEAIQACLFEKTPQDQPKR